MITHCDKHGRFGLCTIIMLCLSGCDSRPKLEASDFLPASDEVVTAYGVTLDEHATPEQSAWVLLMAARDDVRTAIHSPEWRELMKLQCRLADVELLREMANKDAALSREKADAIFFRMIKSWASALNYYAEFFDDEFEAARARMTLRNAVSPRLPEGRRNIQLVQYVLTARAADFSPRGSAPGENVAPYEGPRGPKPATLDSGVTVQFLLSKTHKGYWRIYKLQLAPPPAPSTPEAELGAPS